jgi:two-component system sensor histidine kinase HydH
MTTLTRNIIESMPNVLVAFDGSGRVIEANAAATRLLGVARGQLVGDDCLGTAAAPLVRHIREGEVVLDQEVGLERGGEPAIPASLSGAPFAWEGSAGVVLILRDLREWKAMEERVKRGEKLAALGRLSASVAHEIRNPLSSIKGFAQYFRKRFPEGSREHAHSETMMSEVDRLNNVITNLLDFTRPKQPNLQEGDLAEVARHALQLVRADAQARGVEVACELPDKAPARFDREQLVQVLLNLFLNALEAMPDGGRLRVNLSAGAQGELRLSVSDTGCGVAEDDLPKLFEPFFTTKAKGTGLGLAVALQIVENHGGQVSVASRRGEGTTFVVSLPGGEAAAQSSPQEAA